jgi:eukaryotic-like serine/threonine-protein kinase
MDRGAAALREGNAILQESDGGISSDSGLGASDDALRLAAHAPPVSPPGFLTGKRLGHFRIEAELGRGGMGVVYAAHDEKLGRSVALKVLAEERASDEGRRARFLREARAAAAISHPNLASIYEVGHADGHAYIVMELVKGETLRKRLARGPIPVAEAVRIAVDASRALGKAHEAGLVHRDIKPDNVMLTEEGYVKVLDFGLAKQLVSGAVSVDTITETGRIVGTPSYMSPEQAHGMEIDARADVFSLGVVMHEMIAGRRPFGGRSATEILVAVSRDLPAPLHAPAALRRIISRCLEKDPEKRLPSAVVLGRQLESIPPSELSKGSRPSVPWGPLAIGVGVFATGLLVGRTAGWFEKAAPEPPAATNEHRAAAPPAAVTSAPVTSAPVTPEPSPTAAPDEAVAAPSPSASAAISRPARGPAPAATQKPAPPPSTSPPEDPVGDGIY